MWRRWTRSTAPAAPPSLARASGGSHNLTMRHDVIEPATEAVLSSMLEARPEDVDGAVDDARRAQRKWWAFAPSERARVLLAIADGIEREANRLAELEARNVGMPISDAR